MIRALTAADWAKFWPMLHDMGTDDDEPTAFHERLGYQGEPCPQPEYPTFVIDLRDRQEPAARA